VHLSYFLISSTGAEYGFLPMYESIIGRSFFCHFGRVVFLTAVSRLCWCVDVDAGEPGAEYGGEPFAWVSG
jgi:hypothetical protein